MFGSRARAAEAEVTRLKARVRILERTNDRLWQFVDDVGPAASRLDATTTALIADLTPTGRTLLQSARRQLSEAVRRLEDDMRFALPWVPWAARRRVGGVTLSASDKVIAAWRDAGPPPAAHRRAQTELARTWPTLYAAIRQLVDEAPPPPPPPPPPSAPPATEVRP